jgi:hypothetical protein
LKGATNCALIFIVDSAQGLKYAVYKDVNMEIISTMRKAILFFRCWSSMDLKKEVIVLMMDNHFI